MNYKFFQNKKCEYFPCHQLKEDNFNCLFCYCPLYYLKEKCGGKYQYLEENIKSCENCTIVHNGEEAYELVQKRLFLEVEKTKKN